MCSLAAAVQGMDETVNNGAQAIYFAEDVCLPPILLQTHTDYFWQ
jgi:hypothetical protein